MSQQTDLFAADTHARRDNPTTSHQAAERVRDFAAEHHETIRRVLKLRGTNGLTVHEIAAFCALDAHAIGKRMAELEAAGEVETRVVPGTGAVQTRKTPSGRAARVWFLKGGA